MCLGREGDGGDPADDERIHDADDGIGILANRSPNGALHGRGQNRVEPLIAGLGAGDSRRQNGTDGGRELLRVLELLPEGSQRGSIVFEKDALQRLESRIALEAARQHRRHVVVDAARHLQQEIGQAFGRLRIAGRRSCRRLRIAGRHRQTGHHHVSGYGARLCARRRAAEPGDVVPCAGRPAGCSMGAWVL